MALDFWAASMAVLEFVLGALVAAVSEHDEDLAAGLLVELVVGGEIDGVVEERSAGVAVAGDGAGAGAGVNGGLVHGAFELTGAVGVVGEEIDVDVEGDKEGLVLGGEDVLEEFGAGLLLERQDVDLAAAGVEQDADGEGEILLLGEVLGLLKFLVLVDVAVVLVEVGNVAVFIADGEVDVDEVDVDLDGLGFADIDGRLGGSVAGGRRAPGGWGLLRVGGQSEGGSQGEAETKRCQRKGSHDGLDDRVWGEVSATIDLFREREGGGTTQGVGRTSNRMKVG